MCEGQNLAIIPARSGSKGLSDKNIMDLCGKPMMAYTISAALESSMFADVIVSTDSELYADIARRHGASVPFLRSPENSTDTADSWSVVKEVLDMLLQSGKTYYSVALLQPTSPLRTSEHIKEAYNLYNAKNASAVVSLCKCDYSPLLCNTLDSTLSLEDFIPPEKNMRRQDLPEYYRINGAIYIVSTEFFASAPMPFNPYCEASYAYIMPIHESLDIDNDFDFILAANTFNLKKN